MSSTSPVGGATGATPGLLPAGTPGGLGSDTFLRLLIAELQYQDPLSPMSGSQFLSQLATLESVSLLSQLQQQVSQLSLSQANAEALALVGKTVAYQDSSGQTAQGTVTGVILSHTGPVLTLGGGKQVPLSQVQQVTSG